MTIRRINGQILMWRTGCVTGVSEQSQAVDAAAGSVPLRESSTDYTYVSKLFGVRSVQYVCVRDGLDWTSEGQLAEGRPTFNNLEVV